ncbi:Vgb family protein [Nostoc sp. 'Peltigera membranacea cyanobiont' 232]|uniref:Vgb family protein n=1 Tax=Nostoc sp. 'Peltigera membranacea cyanobiont' 232 TaxID=2014531 RepID=UPI001CB88DDB|nr:PEP-CTERM sorting domain-containing protein [Nostoc sp. 'Peltigera membranacea cyanobiont' 232]
MKAAILPASVLLGSLSFLWVNAPQADAELLIGNSDSNSIIIFDEQTGNFKGNFTTPGSGGLRSPDDLTFGGDGNLYVSSGGDSGLNLFDPSYPKDSAVLRYSPKGKFLGVAASGHGLTRPYGKAFGTDGSLYVSSFRTNQILRFDGKTGRFLGVFASDNNNGLGSPNGLNGPNGLLFGKDCSLYVVTEGTANDASGNLVFPYESQVLRYSPAQVAGNKPTTTPSVFISQPLPLPESFGFVSLLGLVQAPNDDILVSDFAGGIRRYSSSGVLLSTLSTNYTGTTPSNNFIGYLTFGTGNSRKNLYTVGFDFQNNNIGSILAYQYAQGSSTNFSGNQFTNNSLVRPIGITAVPVLDIENFNSKSSCQVRN